MGARGSSVGTGALTRDTGGTTTGTDTLRSRASIGAGGSRTGSLAGGSVETTPVVGGNGVGGSDTAASFETASTGAMSLTVGKGTGGAGAVGCCDNTFAGAISLPVGRGAGGGFGTVGSFESASGNDVGSNAVASLGASAGTISLAAAAGAPPDGERDRSSE